MKYSSLKDEIEYTEYSYCVKNTRLYGENSVRRGGGYSRIVHLIVFSMF